MSTISYPVSTIAKLFDLTERRVQQLAKEGVIPKAASGKYELAPCIKGYIKYLKEKAFGQDGTPNNITVERARLVKMQADNLEQEMKLRNKKLLDSDEVKKEWINMLSCCRSALLAIPNRLGYQVNSAPTPAESAALMKDAINEALDELSKDKIESNELLEVEMQAQE